jgi:hypothetical protein
MANAWWDQCVVELALRNRATSHDLYSPYGDAMFMVNKYGRRALNEKAPYNERGQAHQVWDPSRLEYPNLLMFMITDDSVLPAPKHARFRWPFPAEDEETPFFLISAPDLPGLAAEIGLDVAPVQPRVVRERTFLLVERYDRAVSLLGFDPRMLSQEAGHA